MISEDDQLEKAKEAVYRFLSYRERSILEIREKLEKKGFCGEIIDKTLKRLSELGLVDDEKFAAKMASDFAKIKGYGRHYIINKLREKGIVGDLANEAIEEVFSGVNEIEVAKGLVLKRKKDGTDIWKEIARTGRYLYSRGYGWDVINEAISKVYER